MIDKCYKAYKKSTDQDSHCRISSSCSGWGCKHMVAIATEPACFSFIFWYSIGRFSDDGSYWIVNKEKLLDDLKKEANILSLDNCPVFSFDRVAAKANELPNSIDLSDEEHWLIMRDEMGDRVGVMHAEITDPFEGFSDEWEKSEW